MVRVPPGWEHAFHSPAQSMPERGVWFRPLPRQPINQFRGKISGVPLQPGQAQVVLTNANPVNAVVQTNSNTAVTASLTVPLGQPTTAGHCLVACINVGGGLTVTGVFLGTSADHWAQATIATDSSGTHYYIWTDQGCAGGQTSVTVNITSSQFLTVRVYEVGGILASGAIDQTSAGNGIGLSFSSGTTAATTQATEVAIGAVGMFSSSGVPTITGPGGFTNFQDAWSGNGALFSGYQLLSSTGTVTYSGTMTPSQTGWGSSVITLKTGNPNGIGQVTVGPTGIGNVWYPTQVTVSTTTGVLDGSTFSLYLGPAGVPITLVGTLFPGGAGTLALALPPLTPGQYLIGIWTGGHPGDLASMNVLGTMDALAAV